MKKSLIVLITIIFISILLSMGFLVSCTNNIEAAAGTIEDTENPVLTGLTFSPSELDITDNDAVITFQVSYTDDLSGIKFIQIDLEDPNGNIYGFSSSTNSLMTGTINEGTLEFYKTINQYSTIGEWQINKVRLSDKVSNAKTYNTAELQDMGFDTFINVISNEDSESPLLTWLTYSPNEVDVSDSDANITFQVSYTDNLSGINFIQINLEDPNGVIYGFSSNTNSPMTGTVNNGTLEIYKTINQYSAEGLWIINKIILSDKASNSKSYNTADIQSLGFGTTINVISDEDTEAPVLTGMTFSPSTISTANGNATVTFQCSFTDDISGINYIQINLEDPEGNVYGFSSGTNSPLSGTINNGTLEIYKTINQYSPLGEWQIKQIRLSDNALNSITYSTSNLLDMGFDTIMLNE